MHKSVVICLLLGFSLLTACAPAGGRASPTVQRSSTPRQLPTASPTASVTPTPSPEPSLTPSITSTPAPPTVTPTASQTASPALSETTLQGSGPWALLCQERDQVALFDLGSAAITPLLIRCPDTQNLTAQGERAVVVPRQAAYRDELWVVHLPSLSIETRISLDGDRVAEDAAGGVFAWAPDGNHLLFAVRTGQVQQPVLYHADDGSLVRLPVEARLIHPMGWSPDGRLAVLLAGEGGLEGAWAVNTDTNEIQLLYTSPLDEGVFYWAEILGWLSNSIFVTREGPGEFCDFNLREVNASAASHRLVFWPAFLGAALDPATRTVFLGMGESGACVYPLPVGLYRLDLAEAEPRRIQSGSGWRQIDWSPELGQFVLRAQEFPGVRTYTTSGGLRLQLTEAERVHPSPNGDWILVEAGASPRTRMHSRSGALQRNLFEEAPDQVWWVSDSTLLLRFGSALYELRESEDWVANPIAEGVSWLAGIVGR